MDSNIKSLVHLAKETIKVREEPPIPDEFIIKAIERINANEEEVEKYPGGAPSLKGIAQIASRLQSEKAPIH